MPTTMFIHVLHL